ncbi:hypothetical protein C8Q74DRAFT_1200046, partial [Fomes fomentarius]
IHEYFAQYPDFGFSVTSPFLKEFKRLAKAQRWVPDSPRRKKERETLRDAMVKQFNMMYGKDLDDLSAWKALCDALGAGRVVDPIPHDISQCRKTLKKTHVNLVDFIDPRRNPEVPVRVFPSEKELAKYTNKHRKIFPRSNVHAGSLLKYLLRRIFVV